MLSPFFPPLQPPLTLSSLQTQGGGNCANALTAAARLGAATSLVSKIADDGPGAAILAELAADGVGTAHLLVARAAPAPAPSSRSPGASALPPPPPPSSPFTYIIVDCQGGTRTCIHTPGPAWEEAGDLEACGVVGGALRGAGAAFFDGRLAEGARHLAEAAAAAGVPILVEGERLRPGLDELLAHADAVTTSAAFPGAWTGLPCRSGGAAVAALARLPRARWLSTTLGEAGAVLIERVEGGGDDDAARPLADPDAVFAAVLASASAAGGGACLALTSPGGVPVGLPGLATRTARVPIPAGDAATAAAAGDAAAAANADAGRGGAYAGGAASPATTLSATTPPPTTLTLRFTAVSAAALPPGAVVDTTGAGDAFNGALLFALAQGWPPPPSLALAAAVAAAACTALGARAGLPVAAAVSPGLLRGEAPPVVEA